ncbi:hypothetical protein Pcinc_040760 [Petrolisthes cinctipes]|uniref:Uncharacterized protein n=1 Tax=Petrolisthes cinctipes TaxID=88211 RepID=A0AAE1BLK9_PETCI|nr:hypothetical protein Pcinc_040760 [Petrolisthes cinctipes]
MEEEEEEQKEGKKEHCKKHGGSTDRGSVVTVEEHEEGPGSMIVAVVKNPMLIPVALADLLLAGALSALNYVLRYDTNVKEDCGMLRMKEEGERGGGRGGFYELDLSETNSTSSEEQEQHDEEHYNTLALNTESFPIIPRATTTLPRGASNLLTRRPKPTHEAVNPLMSPPTPPPPPPTHLPPTPPPPHTPWTISSSNYNVPRQRYSAPAPTPRLPPYDTQQQQ